MGRRFDSKRLQHPQTVDAENYNDSFKMVNRFFITMTS